MPNLIDFCYENNDIRVILVENEPWFVAKDIATALGYENTDQAIRQHCDSSKQFREINPLNNRGSLNKISPSAILIDEGDLYSLIFGSKKKTAKKFKRWVTHDVLPSIRKTGKYEIQSAGSVQKGSLVVSGEMQKQLSEFLVNAGHVVNVIDNELKGIKILKREYKAKIKELRLEQQEGPMFSIQHNWATPKEYYVDEINLINDRLYLVNKKLIERKVKERYFDYTSFEWQLMAAEKKVGFRKIYPKPYLYAVWEYDIEPSDNFVWE